MEALRLSVEQVNFEVEKLPFLTSTDDQQSLNTVVDPNTEFKNDSLLNDVYQASPHNAFEVEQILRALQEKQQQGYTEGLRPEENGEDFMQLQKRIFEKLESLDSAQGALHSSSPPTTPLSEVHNRSAQSTAHATRYLDHSPTSQLLAWQKDALKDCTYPGITFEVANYLNEKHPGTLSKIEAALHSVRVPRRSGALAAHHQDLNSFTSMSSASDALALQESVIGKKSIKPTPPEIVTNMQNQLPSQNSSQLLGNHALTVQVGCTSNGNGSVHHLKESLSGYGNKESNKTVSDQLINEENVVGTNQVLLETSRNKGPNDSFMSLPKDDNSVSLVSTDCSSVSAIPEENRVSATQGVYREFKRYPAEQITVVSERKSYIVQGETGKGRHPPSSARALARRGKKKEYRNETGTRRRSSSVSSLSSQESASVSVDRVGNMEEARVVYSMVEAQGKSGTYKLDGQRSDCFPKPSMERKAGQRDEFVHRAEMDREVVAVRPEMQIARAVQAARDRLETASNLSGYDSNTDHCEMDSTYSDRLETMSNMSDVSGFEEEMFRIKKLLLDPTSPVEEYRKHFVHGRETPKATFMSSTVNDSLVTSPPYVKPKLDIAELHKYPYMPKGQVNDVRKEELEIQLHHLNVQMNNTIQEKEKYQKENAMLQSQLSEDWQEKYSKVLRQNQSLEGQLESMKVVAADSFTERTQLKTHVASLQSEVQTCNANVQLVKQERDNLHLEAEVSRRQIMSMQEQVRELQVQCEGKDSEVNSWREELQESDSANQKLRIELEEFKVDGESKDAAIQGLKRKIAEQHVEIQNTLQEKLKAVSDLRSAQNATESVQKSKEWYQEQLHQSQNARSKLQQEMMSTQANAVTLSNQVEKMKGEVVQLRQQLVEGQQRAMKEKEALMHHLEGIEADMIERERLFEQMQQDKGQASENILTKIKELEKEKSKYSDMSFTIVDLQHQIEVANAEIRSKDELLEQFEREQAALLQRITVVTKKVGAKELFVQSLENKYKDLEQTLLLIQNETKQKDDLIHEMTQDKLAAEVTLALANKEKEEVNETVSKLHDDFVRVSSNFQKLKLEINNKEKMIDALTKEKQETESNLRLKTASLKSLEKLKEENAGLQRKIVNVEKMENQIEQLKRQNKEMGYKIAQVTQDRSVLEKERLKLEETLKFREEQIMNQHKHFELYCGDLEGKNDLLQTLKNQKATWEEQTHSLKQRIQELKDENDTVVKSKEDLGNELNVAKMKIKKLEEEMKISIEEKLLLQEKLTTENNQTQFIEEINVLRSKIIDLEGRVQSVTLQKNVAISQMEEAEGRNSCRVKALKNRHETLEHELGLLKLKQNETSDMLEQVLEEKTTFKKKLRESQEEVEAVRIKLEETLALNEQLIAQSGESSSEILKQEIEKLRTSSKEDEKQIRSLFEENGDLLTEVEKLQKENYDLKVGNDRCDTMQKELEENRGKLKAVEADLNHTLDLKEQLSQQLSKSQDNCRDVENELMDSRQERVQLQNVQNVLEERVQNLEEHCKNVNMQIIQVEKERSVLKIQLANLQRTIQNHDLVVETLEAQQGPHPYTKDASTEYDKSDSTFVSLKVQTILPELNQQEVLLNDTDVLRNDSGIAMLDNNEISIKVASQHEVGVNTDNTEQSYFSTCVTATGSQMLRTIERKEFGVQTDSVSNISIDVSKNSEPVSVDIIAAQNLKEYKEEIEKLKEMLVSAEKDYKERHRRYESNVQLLTRKLKEHMKARKKVEKELAVLQVSSNIECINEENLATLKELKEKVSTQEQQLEVTQKMYENEKRSLEVSQQLALDLEKEKGRLEGIIENHSVLKHHASSLETELAKRTCAVSELDLHSREVAQIRDQEGLKAKERIRELEDFLDHERSATKELRRQIFNEKRENSHVKKQISSLKFGLETANQLIESKKQEIDGIQTELQVAQQSQLKLRAEFEALNREYACCKEQLDVQKRELEQSKAKDPVLADQLKMLGYHLHQKNLEVSGLQEQLRLVEERQLVEMEGLQRSIEASRTELQSVKEELDRIRSEKFAYQNQVAELRGALQNSVEQNKVMKMKLEASESQSQESEPLSDLSVSLPSPSKYDESFILQLLQQSAVVSSSKPLSNLQTCLNSLKVEMGSLQKQIIERSAEAAAWRNIEAECQSGDKQDSSNNPSGQNPSHSRHNPSHSRNNPTPDVHHV